MSTVSAILGAEAAPRTFTHNGQRYTLRAFDQYMKTEWERWLENCAWESVVDLSPAAQKIAAETVSRNVVAQEYRFYSEVSARAMTSPRGAVKLACMIFGCAEEVMERLLVERPEEVQALVKVTLEEATIGGFRPNRTAPAPAQGAGATVGNRGESASGGPVREPPIDFWVAQLITEPHRLPMDRVARLTDYQIAQLYFYPRTKEGALVAPAPPEEEVPAPEPGSLEQYALYSAVGRNLGCPQTEIDRAWKVKWGKLPGEMTNGRS